MQLTKGKRTFVPYTLHQKVWLKATNLKTMHPTAKLAPRCYGPFQVKKVISPVMYQLEILKHWKIHDIFHTLLLTPYVETEMQGQIMKNCHQNWSINNQNGKSNPFLICEGLEGQEIYSIRCNGRVTVLCMTLGNQPLMYMLLHWSGTTIKQREPVPWKLLPCQFTYKTLLWLPPQIPPPATSANLKHSSKCTHSLTFSS